MSSRQQIVGDKKFKNKKDLHLYTEKLLEEKGICIIDKTDIDYNFFISLYLRKPSHQKNKDINYFKLELDPIKKNKTNNLSYVDHNNNENVFSWRKCCDGRDTNNNDKLKEACRTSIKEQTKNCWINNNKCYNCGTLKSDGFEVDHFIEFSNIYNNFINITKLKIPNEFESSPITSQYMFTKKDLFFEEAFQKYHQENAILRLLCKSCHRDKTNKFISNKN